MWQPCGDHRMIDQRSTVLGFSLFCIPSLSYFHVLLAESIFLQAHVPWLTVVSYPKHACHVERGSCCVISARMGEVNAADPTLHTQDIETPVPSDKGRDHRRPTKRSLVVLVLHVLQFNHWVYLFVIRLRGSSTRIMWLVKPKATAL
jgi:hypothetical protein